MQIHQCSIVFINLSCIYEYPCEVQAVLDISATPSPLPAVGGELSLQLVLVAATAGEIAHGTRLRDGVGYAS